MKIVIIFLVGLAILVAALLLNFIANKLGILTWYDFVSSPSKARFIDYIWLFVLYPFLLGATAYAAVKFLT